MRWRALALVLAFAASAAPASAALEVTRVYHEPKAIDASRGESVTIHFRISEPARVGLHIYDGRDLRIRELPSESLLDAGDHQVAWDGRDFAGRPVPAEAYVYTIEAASAAGERVVWDVSDLAGETFTPARAEWNPEKGAVTYELADPARVRLRLGLRNGGPLLRTLVDWVPRGPGPHQESWDGKDASGVLDLAQHPSLAISARAFSLPRNAVLVLPAPDRVTLIADVPPEAARREVTKKSTKRMFDYARQQIEVRRDFPMDLVLPADLEKNAEGLPIVTGPLRVRIEVSDADLASALNERCEAVFYVDGRFVFENEVGFLPMTWTWHPRGANEGVHYITANLRGYEGHFGMATVPVFVKQTERTN